MATAFSCVLAPASVLAVIDSQRTALAHHRLGAVVAHQTSQREIAVDLMFEFQNHSRYGSLQLFDVRAAAFRQNGIHDPAVQFVDAGAVGFALGDERVEEIRMSEEPACAIRVVDTAG
jgi:hypothetical protein